MKAAFAIVALILALQQQTFYSAKAAPKIPPRATAQPVNADYLYYACSGGRRVRTLRGRANPCAGSRPTTHPRPTHRPGPRHT